MQLQAQTPSEIYTKENLESSESSSKSNSDTKKGKFIVKF